MEIKKFRCITERAEIFFETGILNVAFSVESKSPLFENCYIYPGDDKSPGLSLVFCPVREDLWGLVNLEYLLFWHEDCFNAFWLSECILCDLLWSFASVIICTKSGSLVWTQITFYERSISNKVLGRVIMHGSSPAWIITEWYII